jgi:hypothetical protein
MAVVTLSGSYTIRKNFDRNVEIQLHVSGAVTSPCQPGANRGCDFVQNPAGVDREGARLSGELTR